MLISLSPLADLVELLNSQHNLAVRIMKAAEVYRKKPPRINHLINLNLISPFEKSSANYS